VRFTSAEDIIRLMSRFNSSIPFTDASNGFYGILAETFAKLAAEEDSACDWEGLEPIDYPEFGSAGDEYEDIVKPFYRVWINFSTKKTFSWRDQYRAADAPNRATRRLIEKENQRLREDGIREFNDTVRSFVAFVRKRDPRYIPNSQSEADRQKILRDAAAAQAARSRAANQAKLNAHVIQDWAKTHEPDEMSEFSESEESEVEHIECVVCGKTFKSEKQFETHEKSKKHIKAVQQLQREMRKENKILNLDTPSVSGAATPVDDLEKLKLEPEDIKAAEDTTGPADEENGTDKPDHENEDSQQEPKPDQNIPLADPSDSSSEDDEYAPRRTVESRLLSSLSSTNLQTATPSTTTSNSDNENDTPKQKLGKAKAKRLKKAAKQEASAQENQDFKCAACNHSFASKTKLFTHIKEEGHAQPVPQPAIKAGKGKGKKR
jgi:DnaJ family protein A protein 5